MELAMKPSPMALLTTYIGTIRWHYTMALYIGTMHWHYALALCIDTMHWHYTLALYFGTIHELLILPTHRSQI